MNRGNYKARIYLAAPYSDNPNRWTAEALRAASVLIDMNFCPFVPHLCHFWDFLCPGDYERWFGYVSSWISTCDILVFIDGPSAGVLREVEIAASLNMPIWELQDFLITQSDVLKQSPKDANT